MKQTIAYIFSGLLILLALAYLVAIYACGSLVERALLRIGPQILQAPVSLEDATLAPLSGQGSLDNLRIGNPPGWSENPALRVGRVQMRVRPLSVFDPVVEVEELVIRDLVVNYETKIVASNISDLLKNVEAALGKGDDAKAPPAQSPDDKPVRLIVRRLVLNEATVNLSAGARILTIPLPEISLVELGVKEGGLTPAQLGFAILRSLTASVVTASTRALGTLGGTSGASALENAKQIGEAIKSFFGGETKK